MPDETAHEPSSFTDRYLDGEFRELFDVDPRDPQAALARPDRIDRDTLADALEAQAERFGTKPQQRRALERLRHPASRVVVTGQQPGLLLGPVYALSKAYGAVALARRWDEPHRPVVPVFWIASQDHDTAEIDRALLLDLDERLHRLRVDWPEGVPSGRIRLGDEGLRQLTAGFQAMRVPEVHRAAVTSLLEEAWRGADTAAELFARLLSSLMGREGLLLLDPLDDVLARRVQGVLEAELQDPGASVRAIEEAAERLRVLDERPQLGRGAQATNLFLQEGAGTRRLLRHDGDGFFTDGDAASRWRPAELRARLAEQPTLITPAAGLRPVVQDALLPTAAVVVGPGELRYFAQLQGVYRRHGVAMPLVWPRPEAVLLEPPVARILARHEVAAREVQRDPEGTLRSVLLRRHGHAERFEASLERLDAETETLLREVRGVDPTLAGAVERGRGYLRSTVRRLREKVGEALTRHDEDTRRQFGRLRCHLLPGGAPQERALSPFSFFLKFGVDPVLDRFRELPAEGRHELALDGGHGGEGAPPRDA